MSRTRVLSLCKGQWAKVSAFLAPALKPAIINRPNHVACPVHGGNDGLRAFNDFDETGGMVCNTCGAFSDGIKTLKWVNGWDEESTIAAIKYYLDDPPNMPDLTYRTQEPDLQSKESSFEEVQFKLKYLLATGHSLTSPEAEPTLKYFQKRGLASKYLPDCLKALHQLEFWENGQAIFFPAFIAPVVDANGEIVSIHRTYLDSMGNKAPVTSPKKLMPPIFPGATSGAAIRLYPAEHEVAIAEGIETSIAIYQATGLPCWATVSAGGMQHVQLPPTIKSVSIWADKDLNQVGQKAAHSLRARLLSEGRRVKVLIPDAPIPVGEKGIDWLDVFNMEEEGVLI